MDRKEFLKRMFIGTTAVVVAPSLLLSKNETKQIRQPSLNITHGKKWSSEEDIYEFSISNYCSEIRHNVNILDLGNLPNGILVSAIGGPMSFAEFVLMIKQQPFKVNRIVITSESNKVLSADMLIEQFNILNGQYMSYFHPLAYYTHPIDEIPTANIQNLNCVFHAGTKVFFTKMPPHLEMIMTIYVPKKKIYNQLTIPK